VGAETSPVVAEAAGAGAVLLMALVVVIFNSVHGSTWQLQLVISVERRIIENTLRGSHDGKIRSLILGWVVGCRR